MRQFLVILVFTPIFCHAIESLPDDKVDTPGEVAIINSNYRQLDTGKMNLKTKDVVSKQASTYKVGTATTPYKEGHFDDLFADNATVLVDMIIKDDLIVTDSINADSGTITNNISVGSVTINSNFFRYVPWTSYTPSFSSGWGTPVGIIAFYKIVGDTMEVRGSFGTGTVAASAGTITLPTGYVIDESKDAGMGQSYYGLIFNHQTTAAAIFSADKAGVLTQTTGGVNDRLTFSGRVENNGWQASAINAFFINGDYVSFYASFPVTKT